ncbi:MAG: ABC transporter permease [Planctomycetia bacterium]|nr:ABC transporter permease [Planctomycetia bacterium]
MPDVLRDVPLSPRRDAGVRPFEGFSVVFAWGLRRGFSAKRFRWTAGLTLGIGILLALLHGGARDAAFRLWMSLDNGMLGVGVPLVALALAGGGYAEEVADQTLVYHLVRPVSRATVFLGRFAAGIVPCIATAVALVLAVMLATGVSLPPMVYVKTAAVAGIGATCVGAVYFALGALFRRGLIAGLVYTFVVEALFQFLPGSVQNLSLMHHVRSVFHRWCDADFAPLSRGIAGRIAAQAQGGPQVGRPQDIVFQRATEVWSSAGNALLICGSVLVIALAAGCMAVKRTDYALKDA